MKISRRFLPYSLAIASTAIALLLTLWLEPLMPRTIGVFFYIAIIFSTWFGGFQPGVVTVVLSTLALDYFLIEPRYQFFLLNTALDLVQLSFFVVVALTINLFTSNLKENRQKIARLNQQLIQENKEQLRMALSAARMGMWDWNMVTGEITWSPETEHLFGLADGTFDGKYETFDARLHPHDREGLNQAIQQALQTKSVEQHEFRVIWPDGSIHWVEGRGQGFDDETGKAVRIAGTIVNIDDRKQSEILLHQQFEQQRLLMEMTQRIRQSLNLEDILQTTVEEVRQFLQCDRALIFKTDADYGGNILVESVNPPWNAISSNHSYDPCIGKEYIEPFQQGLVTAKSDIYTAQISPCHREMLAAFQVRANLVVPILQGKNLWGLLVVHHCAAPREWQTSEIELLRQLSAQASIAIQKADLFEQVKTESLRIQTIFNTSFDGLVILNREGKVLEANPRFSEMLGYTPEKTLSLSIFDWDAQFTFEELQKFLNDTSFTSGVFETRHRRQDGSIYDVEIGTSILEWQGEMMRFCACRDITERKQGQIALKELNNALEQRVAERTVELTELNDRLLITLLEKDRAYQLLEEQAQLLDLAHDGIISWDLTSTITFWNHGAELMYGWTKAEAFGQEIKALLKTEFPQPLNVIEAQLLATGYWEGELIHYSRDNSPIAVSSRWVAQKDDLGRLIKVLEINNDISDRKAAAKLLQQSESTLRSFFNSAVVPMGIVELHDGDILHIADNWAAAQFFHNTTAGMQNQFSSSLGTSPATINRWISYYREAQRTQAPVRFEYLHPTNDGECWLSGTVCPITISPSEYPRFSYIVENITERKLAEEILQQYQRIISNTTDGIAMMNREYIYQIANPAYLTWCNKSESEVIGNSLRNILGEELFDNFVQPRLDRCLAGEKIQYERWFDYPNLVPQFLNVTYTPLYDAGENISGVIVSLRDLTQLKQAEQMLELQAVITRNMAEGICLVRADNGVIVYTNPKFEQMFGYEPGELKGKHVSIVNYNSESVTAEEVNQAIRTAVLQNHEFSYEVQNVKKDSTPFWCSATCSVFKHFEYGDVLVAVHQDITLAKHLEEVRQEAEAALLQKSRKENLLWSITQGIRQSLELNAVLNNTVTEIRQTLKTDRTAIYRFNPDWSGDFIVESVGEDWVKLVGDDIHKVWADTYLQENKGGRFPNNENFVVNDIYQVDLQPCHIELLEQFQAKSYAIFPILARGTVWGLLALYQNSTSRNWQSWEIELLEQITSQLAIAIEQSKLYGQLQLELQERQQAEAVLQEAERRWRSLLDNVQLIVVGLDRWGNINYVNPFFLKLTGYTHLEVLGKNWFENFLPQAQQQALQVVFSEVLTHNYHPYYQNLIVTKSGEERFIAWNNTMLQDADENIIGTISIGEDITERHKLEHIKNEFIGIVSHELRTPLTGIQMSLGLIKTGVYDRKPEKARRMIEIALLDTHRLVNLVNDILDLERIDSGRAVLEKTVCKAADLMQQAVDGIQAIATQQQISLIITPTDVKVWAAPDTIIQTLTNLLGNALKFSPPHSTIHLSAENQTDFVLFQVRDRGRGIPADKLELIFGRFQQVDASDSREKGGTGLGLSICQSIIERHGGKIWVESILGEGSTFFFTLPLPSFEL